MLHFNSQPHKEADAKIFLDIVHPMYFNSQPHKEADAFGSPTTTVSFNFNSQPHKEADDDALNNEEAPINISTHSLTRRLTKMAA